MNTAPLASTSNEPQSSSTIHALWKVTQIVLDTLDFNQVAQKICDSLLTELGYLNLGYRIIVLSLYDEKEKGLRRISLSRTPQAQAAMDASSIPFHDIVIPITATDNLCTKAFLEKKEYSTSDWKDILSPPLTPEDARTNQQAAGIKTSMIFPIILKDNSVGTIIFSMIKSPKEVTPSEYDLIHGFTDVVGIAIQNARLYSNLQITTQNLDEANKRLKLLDKLKDEFVSLASHELRTPMTAIKSYVWMVLNHKAGTIDDKAKQYLDIVFNSTERLIHLVNDMLDVSRIESGKVQLRPETFDMNALFTTIQQEFQARSTEKNIKLIINPSSPTPPIYADREKITQVLENLIGNALKFTPSGGSITLSVKKPDDHLEISVIDTGRGIKAEDIPRLFTKFGRLENSLTSMSEAGTGLGLYLSKQYVELHHGQIWVESKLGEGTIFTFTLPFTQPQSNPPSLQSIQPAVNSHQNGS